MSLCQTIHDPLTFEFGRGYGFSLFAGLLCTMYEDRPWLIICIPCESQSIGEPVNKVVGRIRNELGGCYRNIAMGLYGE